MIASRPASAPRPRGERRTAGAFDVGGDAAVGGGERQRVALGAAASNGRRAARARRRGARRATARAPTRARRLPYSVTRSPTAGICSADARRNASTPSSVPVRADVDHHAVAPADDQQADAVGAPDLGADADRRQRKAHVVVGRDEDVGDAAVDAYLVAGGDHRHLTSRHRRPPQHLEQARRTRRRRRRARCASRARRPCRRGRARRSRRRRGSCSAGGRR